MKEELVKTNMKKFEGEATFLRHSVGNVFVCPSICLCGILFEEEKRVLYFAFFGRIARIAVQTQWLFHPYAIRMSHLTLTSLSIS